MAKGVSRDRKRESRWRRIIGEHRRSGLSVREFCRRGKLTETAFYYWRRELQRRAEEHQRMSGPGGSQMPAFVSVQVQEPGAASAGGRVEIDLPGKRRVRVIPPIDRQALADVLAVLEGQPSLTQAAEGGPC